MNALTLFLELAAVAAAGAYLGQLAATPAEQAELIPVPVRDRPSNQSK
jgi:hypothetical protein